jgi:hypothetical protein
MSWWWSSGSQKPASNTNSTPDPSLISSSPSASREAVEKPLSEDEKTHAALGQFMPIFADTKSQTGEDPTQSSRDALREKLQTGQKSQKTETSIVSFPQTMSCRQAFDDAFYCQSLGGQFNHVYRYGELRSCSEHWSQFWFCMRTRSKGEETKRREIEEWYRKREEKYRVGPSSEDVWEEREEKVDRAFDWDPDQAGILEQKTKN